MATGLVLFAAPSRTRAVDMDGDGDTDLDDYAPWAACLSGPDITPPVNCENADADTDFDVDLADFAAFQRVFGTATPPPGMVLIPPGEFLMGDYHDGMSESLPLHAVYVDAFYMNAYEVTNQQYAEALNWAWAEGGLISVANGVVYRDDGSTSFRYCDTTTSSSHSLITWNGTNFGVTSGKENHPMVNVSWYGSVAYCNWRGGMEGRPLCYDLSTWTCNFGAGGYRLPTEAEWEKAARGGTPGHRFPWSDTDTIQHARANYYSWSGYWFDTSPTRGYHPTFNTGVVPYTGPVGYFAPNGYGLYDMAGNVIEWCHDRYDPTYYSISPYSNPQGPPSGFYRVYRGGGWDTWPIACCVARRYYLTPVGGTYQNGFRYVVGIP